MHDVFVKLLRHNHRLEDRGTSSLLYRIATNVCLNRLRSRARRPEVPVADPVHRLAVAGDEDRLEVRSLLDRALGRLPASTATIAVLHLVDGMTLHEVAEVAGLSVSGVRKRLRRLKACVHELAEVEA
jgi:RNA polymerase sigma-70 factor (ECF subfamily)